MDVTVKILPALHVAYVRHVGPYQECHKAWMTLCGWALIQGMDLAQTTFLGLTHDNPHEVPQDKLRYDACFVVPEDTRPDGAVRIKDIPGRKWAVYLHRGPIKDLPRVHERLYQEWLPTSGYEAGKGPSVKIHLTDPDVTPPHDQLTEIRIPLV